MKIDPNLSFALITLLAALVYAAVVTVKEMAVGAVGVSAYILKLNAYLF